MRFTLIIQNFAQLNEVYGEQNAETIKGNCGNTIYLMSSELKALEEMSKMCGEIKVKTGKGDKEQNETRPLITISDLQKLKKFEIIVRRLRFSPFKTKLTPDFKMNWGRNYPKVDLSQTPYRERKEVKVFDVREFVKKKKQEKMFNLLDNNNGGAPSGLPMFPGMGFDSPNMPFPGMPSMPSSPQIPNMFNEPPSNPSFNIDDIVKKIDAKIMEIEKEEERLNNEENSSSKKDNNVIDVIDDLDEIINDEDKRKENNERISNLINDIDETLDDKKEKDESYYDDFFD